MTSAGYVSEELMLVWCLLIVTVVATFFIQRYQIHAVPPSAAAMALGIVCGGIVKLAGLSKTLTFSPAAFFYGLLPPIVFAAGFTLKKKEFFRNFGTITVYAVFGTLISTLIVGLLTYAMVAMGIVKRAHLGTAPLIECFLYGALISATDPVATLSVFADLEVPPILYNLVFGESVLNDAVAIVLFRTLEEFYNTPLTWATLPLIAWRFTIIGVGSTLVGIAVALLCAFILKRFELAPGSAQGSAGGLAFNATIYEISLVVMSAYLAYLVAEVLQLSGIVALFFTGIAHAHYSFYSVNQDAQITLKRFFEFAAFLSETFVFAYLGLQVATLGHKQVDLGLLLMGLPLVILARAAGIFPLSWFINKGRKLPLPYNLQTVMWAVGLRGAVAYGLAVNLPQIDAESNEGIPAIESATLVVVIVSTLLFGGLTGPLLQFFGLRGVDDQYVHTLGYQDQHPAVSATHAREAVLEIIASNPNKLHSRWKAVDKRWLKPLFGGRPKRDHDGLLHSEDLPLDGLDEENHADWDAQGPVEIQMQGPAGGGLLPDAAVHGSHYRPPELGSPQSGLPRP
ncbi:hypothetical protein WJX72_012251 [[Myrmecia] bisecta]|uniref:Sodium/hydrogen exchanger n=1 Tax=[Myrmecia] bisecta TaxID=41462 RepID=A0AAW1PL60_9CHLO